MTELKPCPCGKTPTALNIIDTHQGTKYMGATGNCCGEWQIEYRNDYKEPDSKEAMEKAVNGWNEAERVEPQPMDCAYSENLSGLLAWIDEEIECHAMLMDYGDSPEDAEQHNISHMRLNQLRRIVAGQAKQVSEPQPMETAPRDGTSILAWWKAHGKWVCIDFNEELGRWLGACIRVEESEFTHWIPMPEGPVIEAFDDEAAQILNDNFYDLCVEAPE